MPLVAALRRERPDAVVFEFYSRAEQLLPLVRAWCPGVPVLIDSVDIHFRRVEARAVLTGDPRDTAQAHATRTAELATYALADLVIVVTEEDRRALVAAGMTTPTARVPNFHAIPPCPQRDLRQPGSLLFVGGFLHDPNTDAVRWLVNEILPLIRRRVPHVRLTIIGQQPPPDVEAMASDSLRVLGHVPDIQPLLQESWVSVAPLRYGAGIKGKVGEAMAFGLPVVTTSVGAEGFGVTPGVHLLVADSAPAFAEATVTLLTDAQRHEEVSRQGRAFIEAHYSEAVVGRLALDVFRGLPDLPVRRIAMASRVRRKTAYYAGRCLLEPLDAWYQRLTRAWGRYVGWRLRPSGTRIASGQ
jgi:glycosyltransferase involved in cell wall biosynthesis